MTLNLRVNLRVTHTTWGLPINLRVFSNLVSLSTVFYPDWPKSLKIEKNNPDSPKLQQTGLQALNRNHQPYCDNRLFAFLGVTLRWPSNDLDLQLTLSDLDVIFIWAYICTWDYVGFIELNFAIFVVIMWPWDDLQMTLTFNLPSPTLMWYLLDN